MKRWGGGGGGMVLESFRSVKGYGFCPFWSRSGLVFEGTTEVYELILHLSSK